MVSNVFNALTNTLQPLAESGVNPVPAKQPRE